MPETVDGSARLPVLIAYHGAGETPEQMAEYSRLDRLAAEEGILVVYPRGRRLSWPITVSEDNPDYLDADLEFFDAILAQLATDFPVDSNRVYAVGMSQGGVFVTLLAAKRSDRLAAIASHSGWIPGYLIEHGIRAEHKVPAMFIAGSEDTSVPVPQVRRAEECFRNEGHRTDILVLPGVGHHWASEHDIEKQIWRFLSVHTRH